MQAQLKPQYYTPEDYLHFEDLATERSEYYDGEIFTMAGGTINHNQITGNIYAELHIALRKKDFRVYMADVKVWITQRNTFNYPDVMVIAGMPQFYENRHDIVLNPQVIIEVLSDSTEGYDRGDKFAQYRTLESLQEYILINQNRYHIEHFKKMAAHEWLFTELQEKQAGLKLESLGIILNLADIYDKVEFENQKA
jgi:Uma2 family endonuclease